MTALDQLAAAFEEVRNAAALAADRMHHLAQDLAIARAEAADAGGVSRMAADLRAMAEQLRAAVAVTETPPQG